FQPAFDAVAALARLLEFMAKEGVSLSSIMTRVPPIHMDRATVACPWDRKGQVMRTLIETEPKDKMELLDGIKVYHGSGWALVLPDSDEPVFHVYCEAASMESAIELKELYVSKINKISSADDPMGRSGDRTHEL
ncbi:MAG: nucleotidyltransferase, partial [Bacillota bacterium]